MSEELDIKNEIESLLMQKAEIQDKLDFYNLRANYCDNAIKKLENRLKQIKEEKK